MIMERGGGSVGLILDTSSIITASANSASMESSAAARAVFSNPRVPDEMDFFSKKPSPLAEDLKVPSLAHNANRHLDHDDDHLNVNTGLHLLTASVGSDRSSPDDGVSSNEEDRESRNINELNMMQGELGKLKEENQRLKSMLNQVTGNYNSLHMQFISFMQQKNQGNVNGSPRRPEIDEKMDMKKHAIVPRQFMDLGLASAENDEVSSMDGGSRERSASPNNFDSQTIENGHHSKVSAFRKEMPSFDHEMKPRNIVREESPERVSQGWTPNKSPKLSNSNNSDQAQEATMRKARVSVRARSEAPMITDGCQWRKYGQKMAKGNPCPRAYYRCTMAAGCPVRKQVQRCADDRTILITTYEGNHNHPLPPAAVAMASTTSAAATMLLSGSMSSADSIINPKFLAKTMLPCSSSLATISASAPFPTVTLDLTQTNPNNNPLHPQRAANATQFQIPDHLLSSSSSAHMLFGHSLGNGQSKFSGLHLSEQKPLVLAADTVSAATAAITADPNFTAALAAAITSIIGNSGAGDQQNSNNNNIRDSNRDDTS